MPGKRLRVASWSGLFGAVLVAGLLTGGTAAYASTTWIVDNTNSACNDTGPNAGTSAQPFCTIAAAAKKAVAGRHGARQRRNIRRDLRQSDQLRHGGQSDHLRAPTPASR